MFLWAWLADDVMWLKLVNKRLLLLPGKLSDRDGMLTADNRWHGDWRMVPLYSVVKSNINKMAMVVQSTIILFEDLEPRIKDIF